LRQVAFAGPSQTIPGVARGRYTLVLSANGDNPFSARKTVDVGNVDSTIDLPVLRALTIRQSWAPALIRGLYAQRARNPMSFSVLVCLP
jgi:hypothetical protein